MYESSSIQIGRLAALSQEEKEACTAYQSEATYFHVCAQRRERELTGQPGYDAFLRTAAVHLKGLEGAIAKFAVTVAGPVYSGHANGMGIVGAIRGDYRKLIGVEYCYPGFISTSPTIAGADVFLDRNSGASIRPVMLKLALDVGMPALPMAMVTNTIEADEIVIGRNVRFDIADAECRADKRFDEGVLWLTLEPHR